MHRSPLVVHVVFARPSPSALALPTAKYNRPLAERLRGRLQALVGVPLFKLGLPAREFVP